MQIMMGGEGAIGRHELCEKNEDDSSGCLTL